MSKSLLTFIFVVFSAGLFAQSPNAFNYQAALRDNQGALLNNQSIGLKIEIENSTGVVYTEESVVQTNAFGIINVQVGINPSSSSNTFADIDWAQGPYSLNTYVDPSGGQSYQFNSSSDILSVPYAKYAERAENLDNGYRLSNFYPILRGRETPSAKWFGAQVKNNNGVKYHREGAGFIRMPILIESVNGPTFNMQGTSVALRFNHGSGTDFLWGLDGTPQQSGNVGYEYHKDSTKIIIYGFKGFYDFDNLRMAPENGVYDIIINPNLPNERVLDMKLEVKRDDYGNCTICN